MAALHSANIIHKVPLVPADLPAHPAFQNVNTSDARRPDLKELITATLHEGDVFTNTFTWAGPEKAKPSAPSAAKVEIGKRSIHLGPIDFAASLIPSRVGQQPGGLEHWYGRRSQHENAEKEGTASFRELDAGLRQDHSPQEADYTPDIYDCVTIADYQSQIEAIKWEGGITKPDLKVYEMAHDLGAMLTPRVFGIAVVSGQLNEGKTFVVVQLPIDLSDYAGAMYSNGRNVRDGNTKLEKKRCLQGYYASIERGINHGATTEWTMVTSSDAGGNLPQWLQNKVAPGKVVHDVGLFIKWNHSKRPSPTSNEAPQ